VSYDDPAEALRERARVRLGQTLRGKWRIDTILGVGGMAVVYAATHVTNGRRVAIKLMHPELSTNIEVRTRFQREGYVANKLQHPGSVAVLDDDISEDGAAYIVMELLEGETLEDRRERTGTLPVHEVLSLADRLLDVLAAAHDKGIVHRDVKPENVFLCRDGTVKVLDFGIARMRELQGARLTMTSAGAIGTPAFMSPEQARGRWESVGPHSDIWSVGATMFTLLAGRLVHNAETVNELMLAAMTRPAPPIASVLPGVPAQVAQLVDRALAYDMGSRWQNARQMQAALRAAYQALDRNSLPALPAYNPMAVADPTSVSGVWGPGQLQPMQAAPVAASYAAPVYAAPGMPPQIPPAGTPMRLTANPVTVGGVPVKKSSPVLPIVGAVAGMAIAAVLLWALVLRGAPRPAGSDPASSASAAVSAAPAVSASASAAPAAPTASASASAAPAPEDSATPAAETPSAAPSASAAPKVPIQKPGKFLRNPKRIHR
jgi:serine/threonine-protein kinase